MTKNVMKLDGSLHMQSSYVFRYLKAVETKIGFHALYNRGKYKRYKELFLAATLAQALREHLNIYFFVNLPDDDPPDFSLRHWIKDDPTSDKTTEGILNYEVVDYTGYASDVGEVIDKKLRNAYPADYGIVVFFRHPTETSIDYEALVERYKDEERWIIFISRVTESKSGIKLLKPKWLLVGLTDPKFQTVIDPDLNDDPQLPQVWQAHRGRDKPIISEDFGLELPS